MSNNIRAFIIDIGASKIEYLFLHNEKCIKMNINTPTKMDFEEDMEQLSNSFNFGKKTTFVVIAFPGIIKNGVIVKWPNKPYWEGNNIIERFIQMFDTKSILIVEDCNAGAMASKYIFPDCSNSLFINVGTGIGSGIILNQNLYSGENGFAGEFGHIVVDYFSDDICSCGRTGCLQLVASGKGMASLYKKSTNDQTDNTKWMNHSIGKKILYKGAIYLGKSIANTVNLLDINNVHISGSVLKNDIYRKQALDTVMQEEKKFLSRKLSVVITSEMNSSLLGACIIAINKFSISATTKKNVLANFPRDGEMS
ncbi:Glucokinase [Paenibacillus nuruki]|uniref:Glucokinase n=1 Tax=Paenibacillus nuruki TaxID=1886670 RepID=A0A1E3KWX3_9BACL|nr:ROK family protein [Paenibacillus nuruki]ODP26042.1 Glucokinase [Paenibacillus nuruki]